MAFRRSSAVLWLLLTVAGAAAAGAAAQAAASPAAGGTAAGGPKAAAAAPGAAAAAAVANKQQQQQQPKQQQPQSAETETVDVSSAGAALARQAAADAEQHEQPPAPREAPLKLDDLPLNPAQACATANVTQAFMMCRVAGASPRCCGRLDELFYAPAGAPLATRQPSAGCLCYPQVLWRVVEIASQAGFDAPGLLLACKKQYGMRASYALQPAGAGACPAIPLNATATSLALQYGGRVPMLGGAARPTWAWTNILQAGDVMAEPAMKAELASGAVLGTMCVKLVLMVFLFTAPLYFLVHHGALNRFSRVYRRELSPTQQLVCTQHGVYALVFGLQIVPQTVLAVRCMFKAWTADYFASYELTALLGSVVASRAALYLVEAAVRSVANWSWLLLIHHQLFMAIYFTAVWTENAPALIIGLVLDLFACHELPLYVTLLGYRLRWPTKHVQRLLWGACTWYVVTRVVQTVLIVYCIVHWARNPAVNTTPAFIMTAVLFLAFTVIQAYTLLIYRGIGRKLAARAAGRDPSTADGDLLPVAVAATGGGSGLDSTSSAGSDEQPVGTARSASPAKPGRGRGSSAGGGKDSGAGSRRDQFFAAFGHRK